MTAHSRTIVQRKDRCLTQPAWLMLQAYQAAAAVYGEQTWARLSPGTRITALYREIGRLDDAELTGMRWWHAAAAGELT